MYSDGTSYIFVYTVLYIFVFCSQFLTTTASYFKAFSSPRCQRMSESMDFYLWNQWQCEMKSTFPSLFYLTLRKCAVWCSFSLLIQNKKWGFWRAKQIRKDQSVEQSNQCFLSSSSLKCLSNKCAKRRQATGSDRHRLRVKPMSENLMWQLESVRHCYLTPRHGSKTHQMHYWSRNITANFTWHEYANLRNVTSYTALFHFYKILPVERTNQKWYLYNFPIVSPRQQWHQIESKCRQPTL